MLRPESFVDELETEKENFLDYVLGLAFIYPDDEYEVKTKRNGDYVVFTVYNRDKEVTR